MKDHTIYTINEKRPYFCFRACEKLFKIEKDGEYDPDVLTLMIPSLKKEFSITNILQACKVFEKGGPYIDLFGTSPKQAKEDERTKTSGEIIHYMLEKKQYPSRPDDLFLIWLYFLALKEHPLLSAKICQYDGFECTWNEDIAKALCLYVSLSKNKKIQKIETFEEFQDLLYSVHVAQIKDQMPKDVHEKSLVLKRPVRKKAYAIGDWIMHPTIGKGEVIKKDAKTYTIFFKVSGPKTLLKQYVETQCKPL